jgi:uncharacterized protein YukE
MLNEKLTNSNQKKGNIMAHQIRANSEELFQFSRNLKSMGEALTNNYNRLRAQVNRVNESWEDEENRRFMEDFLQKADFIYKIAEEMDIYGVFIDKKATRLQDYENTRM